MLIFASRNHDYSVVATEDPMAMIGRYVNGSVSYPMRERGIDRLLQVDEFPSLSEAKLWVEHLARNTYCLGEIVRERNPNEDDLSATWRAAYRDRPQQEPEPLKVTEKRPRTGIFAQRARMLELIRLLREIDREDDEDEDDRSGEGGLGVRLPVPPITRSPGFALTMPRGHDHDA
ncbi:MAG: hypothetical protein U0S12_14715 [Fimbriimonadales bacterium]